MVRNLLAAILCGVPLLAVAAEPDPKQVQFFEKRIRPVLVAQCYECHSADKQKGGLRLDSRAATLAGGESGPAVVPGKPQESLLLNAIAHDGLEMPPAPKKPLSESVVADFRKWIQQGAADPREAEVTQTEGDESEQLEAGIDVEAGRAFWSFQPIANPEPPKVQNESWPVTDMDRFVLAKLEAEKLTPVVDADRATLIRRLYFDLIGLPPTPEEVDAFLADEDVAATAKLVDRLLAMPQFGERWGRHWLDIARYAESNGNVRNATFPHAWRYRDYVIAAFNSDKPYDRFITEQLAGDLLPYDSPEQRSELLVATGFLALGSKPNVQSNPNFAMDIVADQIETTSLAMMGLTVGCARCHDHKYDPIPTRDYYALAGIFASSKTLYGGGGNNMGGAPVTALHVLDGSVPEAPPAEAVDPMAKKKNNKKGQGPKYPPGTPLAMGIQEGSIADCRINLKGEANKLGASVPRGFVQVCSLGDSPAIGDQDSGRLQLAQWLISPQHPLTTRVVVNRIWHHLFGQGIVASPDNFGLHGERPTNPELLDYLAQQFQQQGWSFKKLIRQIVLSRTYQLSTTYNEQNFERDPDNHFVWRHQRRRLDAESFRDAVLAVSGELDLSPGEASDVARIGDGLIQDKLTPDRIHKPSLRRSIYLCIMRNGEPEELLVFDLADPSLIVGARNVTTVPTQGLFLMNSPFIVAESEAWAQRLTASQADDGQELPPSARITRAYREALGREPTTNELARSIEFINQATTDLAADKPDPTAATLRAWSGFCQSLFVSNEFRFVD